MRDLTDVKALLMLALNHKKEIAATLDAIDIKDVERDLLVVPSKLINEDLRTLIIKQAQGVLSDYTISFRDNIIYLNLKLNAKQLGPIVLDYALDIKEFRFDGNIHKIYATFTETVLSQGNAVQKLAVMAASGTGTILKKAIGLSGLDFLHADKNNLLIDMDKAPFGPSIPENVKAECLSCANEVMTFRVTL